MVNSRRGLYMNIAKGDTATAGESSRASEAWLQPGQAGGLPDIEAPLLTVIVPAFNAGWCVGRALESVKRQDFADFECLVVDDGSADDTAGRVEAEIAGDPRFRLIRQDNTGVSGARNRALREARGRYVANLDADDMWRPGFLQRAVDILERSEPRPAMVFARSLWINPDETPVGGERRKPFGPIGYREILLDNPIGNGSAAVMRRDAVLDCGGWDVDIVRIGQTEDWLLQLQVATKGPVVPIDEQLVLYRVSEQGASAAVERSARASLEVVRRCQRHGPRLRRTDYWMARSVVLLWLLQRARKMGRKELTPWLAANVYLRNPLWFTHPKLREPLVLAVTKRLGRLGRILRLRAG